jgi:hypothetical protein
METGSTTYFVGEFVHAIDSKGLPYLPNGVFLVEIILI